MAEAAVYYTPFLSINECTHWLVTFENQPVSQVSFWGEYRLAVEKDEKISIAPSPPSPYFLTLAHPPPPKPSTVMKIKIKDGDYNFF